MNTDMEASAADDILNEYDDDALVLKLTFSLPTTVSTYSLFFHRKIKIKPSFVVKNLKYYYVFNKHASAKHVK